MTVQNDLPMQTTKPVFYKRGIFLHALITYLGVPAILAAYLSLTSGARGSDDWSVIFVYGLLITPAALITWLYGAFFGALSLLFGRDSTHPRRWFVISLLLCLLSFLGLLAIITL